MPVLDRPLSTPVTDRPTVDRPRTRERWPSLDIPGFNPYEDIRNGADITGPYIVIIYNDDWHTFDEVTDILVQATGCTEEKGFAIATEVHNKGRAICFSGSEAECDEVAGIIRTIRLQVETDRA